MSAIRAFKPGDRVFVSTSTFDFLNDAVATVIFQEKDAVGIQFDDPEIHRRWKIKYDYLAPPDRSQPTLSSRLLHILYEQEVL